MKLRSDELKVHETLVAPYILIAKLVVKLSRLID